MAVFALLLGFAVALLLPAEPAAERIFYRAEIWLETSPRVQHLSLVGALRGWEKVAIEARQAAVAGGALSKRQREILRLQECVRGRSPRSTEELLRVVTVFAAREPERVFYSLSDFIAEGLKEFCASVDS